MNTIEELVCKIADREAIRELPMRYCDCLWRRDLDGLIDLFTDDATFVIKGTEVEAVSHGLDELARTHRKALAEAIPRMFVHNHMVNLDGADSATGRCHVEVRDAGIGEWQDFGYIEDNYRKLGDQWKFASRFNSFAGIDRKIWLRTFI